MSNVALPPKAINGSLNTIFNSSDFTFAQNDKTYLKLIGGTITGSLLVNNTISCSGITSSSGLNQFSTNITLPTTFTATPNLTFPDTTQLGGFLTAVETNGIQSSTGTVQAITSLQLNPGVYMVSFRGVIAPTVAGTGTYTNVRFGLSTTSGIMNTTDIQRVQTCASQSATQGSANGYDCALMGSTILQVSTLTTYYLNGCSVFTSTQPSKWTGHIHAVRIA